MPTKSLIKKTRKPRDPFKPKVERELTHINEEQALQRHIYCIPPHHCDHPQDGWCRVGNYPTILELEEINTRLSGKDQELPEGLQPVKRTRRKRGEVVKLAKYFCMDCEEWHLDNSGGLPENHEGIYWKHLEFKRKRGQRLPSQLKKKAPASYFCTKCQDWHQEPNVKFLTHAKYKRKRGRQKGWNQK